MNRSSDASPIIHRDIERAGRDDHDLIVVGGGIYGVCLAFEAARRGLRPLLLERSDFGGATSWNSLRIVHGGLRYLQDADLRRFRASIGEQRWFLEHLPDLVQPLACVLPLFGRGLYRPPIFRVALALNNALGFDRNRGLDQQSRLPASRVLSAAETVKLVPGLDSRRLRGGALWHDAVMTMPERVLMEVLRWAVSAGAQALNYVEANDLLTEGSRVTGVEATDVESGGRLRFRAPVVFNCAGPWCRALARRFDRDVPALFHPSFAFNVLLDHAPPSSAAVAVAGSRGRNYFVVPRRQHTLAGTYHMPWRDDRQAAVPPPEAVRGFLDELKSAIPGFDVEPEQVLRILSGELPAIRPGAADMAHHPVFHDHGRHRGPVGCFSISGVKYTTARQVAAATVVRIFGRGAAIRASAVRPAPVTIPTPGEAPAASPVLARLLVTLAETESALHLDDVLLRRLGSAYETESLEGVADAACRALGWTGDRRAREMERLAARLAQATMKSSAPRSLGAER